MAETASPRRRQPRQPIEVRREQALDAALSLITHRGYAAVSMEAIAREGNLSKPVLYNAYPNLDALLLALLEREEARAFGALAAALPPQPVDVDASGVLLHWVRTLAHAVADNPGPWRLMLIPPEGTPPLVRDHVAVGRAMVLDQIRSLTRRLRDQSRFPAAFDVDLTAHALFAAAEHTARLLVGDPASYPPERVISHVETLVGAFGAPSAGSHTNR